MTTASTEPALVDWSFTAGDDTTITFEFWDDDDQTDPSDLTGKSYAAEVRSARNQDGDAAATCTTSVGGDDSNEVTLTLTATQTRALRDDGRRYFYDLEETVDATGATVTIISGSVHIRDDVTR